MAIAAFFCFFLGVYPEYLYKMLPFPVSYHPYSAYHLSETLQLLGFTGFGFFIMVKKLKPKPKINLDLDWLYRKGARVFIWLASRPVGTANNWVNSVYRTVGLRVTMALARALSWFDWEGIDWVIDGSARGVVEGGNQVRSMMTGKIQHYIGGAVAVTFIILILVVLL
jgi:multicomponent Na+:H+ antiporter subunit D